MIGLVWLNGGCVFFCNVCVSIVGICVNRNIGVVSMVGMFSLSRIVVVVELMFGGRLCRFCIVLYMVWYVLNVVLLIFSCMVWCLSVVGCGLCLSSGWLKLGICLFVCMCCVI